MGLVCFGNWLLSASMDRVGGEGLPTFHTKAMPEPWDCPQNGASNAPRPGRQKEI